MRIATVSLMLLAACGSGVDSRVTRRATALFDCNDRFQRFACADPADPDKRFVCHGTGSVTNPYVKLAISRSSQGHVPGVSHGTHASPDQAAGASSADVGAGPGLDCECAQRNCQSVCTGARDGDSCDDGNLCTGDGACLSGVCQPGAPACAPGVPVDECTVTSGACDPASGECLTEPRPAGSSCEGGKVCDGAGSCVQCLSAATCPGVDDACGSRTCSAGTCGQTFAAAGTSCGTDLACDGSGSCAGVGRMVINEVESSGGVPGDWVELFNAGKADADISGWKFLDNDDTHKPYVIPSGTVIAAGGYYLLEEVAFVFGLGAADSARLFDATGRLVERFDWTVHATTTYGRCPNGSGPFVTTGGSTKGAANNCGGGSSSAQPWPGRNQVAIVDDTGVFGGNLSDLFYEPGVLWAVRNAPSTLFRLVWNGSVWTPDPAGGMTLHYPGGTGSPDAEGVTRAEGAIYVATERDNDVSGVSHKSVLRFDVAQPGAELVATHEWNLNAALPATGANLGLEAITWIPDSFLVANAFAGYDPSQHPNHGSGLFFVGLESNGAVYAFALDHLSGSSSLVATFASGDSTSKALYFDGDTGYLWSFCGASCGNQSAVLTPAGASFAVRRRFAKPSTMANISNEGIAIAPDAECNGGFKPFFWADDANTGGHSLRADSIPCGKFIP